MSEFYFTNVDESAKAMQSQIQQLDAELDKLSEGGDISLVSQEKPSMAYADILTRGIYTARKERVEANTPHFLPPLPAGYAAQSPGARGVDGQPGKSFDRARHRQSHVE